MKIAKISVIIPCYNIEDYLPKCLESILSQTEKDIELICIDDGSKDNTREVLENYKNKHSNIRVLYQNNKGAGPARNLGIENSNGEYIAFMDGDDFYPNHHVLERLYNFARKNNAKICGGSMCLYSDGVISYQGLGDRFIFKTEQEMESKEYPTYGGFTRFIYLSDFILYNKISFPNYLRGEDPPFLISAIANAGKIYCIRDFVYCYRKNHKKIIYNEKKAVDLMHGLIDTFKIAKKHSLHAVYNELLRDLHGKNEAIMYKYVASDSEKMIEILSGVNELIDEKLIDKKKQQFNYYFLSIEEAKKIVNTINIKKNEFLNKITKQKYLYIYGAGLVGRSAVEFLQTERVNIDCFIVTDISQNAQKVNGLNVRCVNDVEKNNNNCTVLVATYEYLQEEITNLLKEKKFIDIIQLNLAEFYLFFEQIEH